MHTKEQKLKAFGRLLDVMDELREHCPWNAEQTMESIRPMTEEEVYELSDAIVRRDGHDICKEIGDLMYHLVFYARIAQEQGSFDIADSLSDPFPDGLRGFFSPLLCAGEGFAADFSACCHQVAVRIPDGLTGFPQSLVRFLHRLIAEIIRGKFRPGFRIPFRRNSFVFQTLDGEVEILPCSRPAPGDPVPGSQKKVFRPHRRFAHKRTLPSRRG